MNGTLYLLHFDPPYLHAQHYLGWTSDVTVCVDRHRRGDGSPLVRAAIKARCEVVLAKTWEGTRSDERALKSKGRNSRRLCPICQARKEEQ